MWFENGFCVKDSRWLPGFLLEEFVVVFQCSDKDCGGSKSGEQCQFSLRHAQFEMPMKHPTGEIIYSCGSDKRREIGGVSKEDAGIYMELRVLTMEITQHVKREEGLGPNSDKLPEKEVRQKWKKKSQKKSKEQDISEAIGMNKCVSSGWL